MQILKALVLASRLSGAQSWRDVTRLKKHSVHLMKRFAVYPGCPNEFLDSIDSSRHRLEKRVEMARASPQRSHHLLENAFNTIDTWAFSLS